MPLSLIIGEYYVFGDIVPCYFTFEVSRHLLKSLLFAFLYRVICLLVLLFPGFSLTLNRFTHSTFLSPTPVEEFFLWFLNFTRLANKNLSCIFRGIGTTAHMCGFSLTVLACLLSGLPVNHSSSQGYTRAGLVRLSGKNRLALRALECLNLQRYLPMMVHGQAFCWSCETVSEPHSSNAI